MMTYIFGLIIDSIFGIVMILFAGGWSDKRGKRKPCMLIPLLGELAALIGEKYSNKKPNIESIYPPNFNHDFI